MGNNDRLWFLHVFSNNTRSEQTVEKVCHRRMRRLVTPKNLGFLGCRLSGKRPWMAFSTDS